MGTLKASGFGQRDTYVWVAAIVHNNMDRVGQTVTVNFNVLDDKGTILKSEAQIESFSQPLADHAVGTQVDLQNGEKAAKVEATLLVEDRGTFSSETFPAMPTSTPTIGADQYGGKQVTFELTNNLKEPVKDARIGIVCFDASRKIIGGTSTYPALVPAGGKIKVDASVIVSGDPASCSVFTGAPVGWQGTQASSASAQPAPTVAAGTAEAAFQAWVEKITPQDWAGQYQTLVSAQKAVISEAQYVECRKKSPIPETSWVALVSTKEVAADTIPGTSASLPSTVVTARIKMAGVTMPLDSQLYNDGGRWSWAMTDANLKGCLG